MAHREQGYRFENDWNREELEEYLENIEAGVTIPVNVEIKAEQHVLSLDRVKHYLVKARKISVMDCNCRLKRRNCDAPVNTCMDLNEIAERNIANGVAREVSLDEALDLLAKTHEAGLVHMAFIRADIPPERGGINSVCSCCSCCCSVLSAYLRFGLAPHLLKSSTASVTDSSKCTSCGVCSDRCQFGAREIVNGVLSFKPDLCFGCGLCVSTCPADAIKLVEK